MLPIQSQISFIASCHRLLCHILVIKGPNGDAIFSWKNISEHKTSPLVIISLMSWVFDLDVTSRSSGMFFVCLLTLLCPIFIWNLFPFSIWSFIYLFCMEFYVPFLFGLLFPFLFWTFISFYSITLEIKPCGLKFQNSRCLFLEL